MDNPEIKNNNASEQSENLSEALQNDGKAKKKKRLIILIITTVKYLPKSKSKTD